MVLSSSNILRWLCLSVPSGVVSLTNKSTPAFSIHGCTIKLDSIDEGTWSAGNYSWGSIFPKIACSHLWVVWVSVSVVNTQQLILVETKLCSYESTPLIDDLVLSLTGCTQYWVLILQGKVNIVKVFAVFGASIALIWENWYKSCYDPRTVMVRKWEEWVSYIDSVSESSI